MKLLIVDDDPISLLIQKKAAQQWGLEVVTATDGESALSYFNNDDPPLLAILDVLMPEPNGIDVCKAIRSLPLSVQPYVIMLTVQSESRDIVLGLEAGANDYVKKPFNIEELRARVRVGVRMMELQNKLVVQMAELQAALANVRRLQGLVPICATCKKIRDDSGYWNDVEQYISSHTEATLTHGVCPECAKEHYPDAFQMMEEALGQKKRES